MSKSLLFVYPHQRIRNLFQANKNIVFLDDRGWWVLDKDSSSRRLIEINDIEVKFNSNVNYKSILKKIEWWNPIWNRWIANADQYELLKREALFYILKIIAGLKFFEISNSIFHTSVSHHLDTSLIEIACAKNNVPQIFLYSNVFKRLLPMIQLSSISDRKVLRRKISSYDSTKDIIDLYKNQAPVSKRAILFNSKTSDKHFRYAVYRLMRDETRSFLANKIKYIIGYEGKGARPILSENKFKLADHLRLVKQQKNALKFYLKNCLSHQEIKNTLENKNSIPLITAHYQPEATSFPEGGDLNNHIDIVLKLRSLKATSAIAYKEHPSTWTAYEPVVGSSRVGMNRSISYYEQLLDLGCKFLPPDYVINNQQKNSWYLPISITGTICIERSLSGLPSIYTGYPFYKGLPGTHSINEITNYNEFAKKIQKPGIFAKEEVLKYLSDILDFTTIVNILGVGNGKTIDDEALIDTFNSEYTQLVNNFI
jgi:hypothetical protein